ncbi:MAG: S24 family peptidase [Patescibacteria group bacterium]
MHDIQKKLLNLGSSVNFSELTLRDIGDAVGEGRENPQKIKHHLQQLVKKGLFVVENGKYKKMSEKKDNLSSMFLSLPILGSANCGEAISFADDYVDSYLKVSPTIVSGKKNVFVVKAKGNSMNRAKINGDSINDGDYVLIDSEKKNPEDGDYVLSIIDGLANIKKFKEDKNREHIILVSESNSNYEPIYIHKNDSDFYSVAGKVFAVLKTS